jgi:hypothetical protein
MGQAASNSAHRGRYIVGVARIAQGASGGSGKCNREAVRPPCCSYQYTNNIPTIHPFLLPGTGWRPSPRRQSPSPPCQVPLAIAASVCSGLAEGRFPPKLPTPGIEPAFILYIPGRYNKASGSNLRVDHRPVAHPKIAICARDYRTPSSNRRRCARRTTHTWGLSSVSVGNG